MSSGHRTCSMPAAGALSRHLLTKRSRQLILRAVELSAPKGRKCLPSKFAPYPAVVGRRGYPVHIRPEALDPMPSAYIRQVRYGTRRENLTGAPPAVKGALLRCFATA